MMERPRVLRDWADADAAGRARGCASSRRSCRRWPAAVSSGSRPGGCSPRPPAVQSGPRIVEIPAHRGFLEVARQPRRGRRHQEPARLRAPRHRAGAAARASRPASTRSPRAPIPWPSSRLLEGGQVLQHNVVFREGSTLAELARPARDRAARPRRRRPAGRAGTASSSGRSRSRPTASRATCSPTPISSSRA